MELEISDREVATLIEQTAWKLADYMSDWVPERRFMDDVNRILDLASALRDRGYPRSTREPGIGPG